MHGSFTKHKLTFAHLLNKYTKAVPKDRSLKKELSSPPCQDKRSSPRGESSKRRGDSTTVFSPQKVYVLEICPRGYHISLYSWLIKYSFNIHG